MARQRRSIEEQISDLVTQGRTGRAHIMATPAMAPVEAAMIADNAIQNEHLTEGSVTRGKMDAAFNELIDSLEGNGVELTEATVRLGEAESRLDSVFGSVSDLSGQVTDASGKATAAQSAAAAAASAASTAQSKADAAQTAAGAAQTTADSALTMAGSKSKVYYGTGNATGTASEGDTWRKVDGAGNVVAEWRWSSGWKSQQITSEVISNLDVGKLTSGTAVIDDAVVKNIAARTSQFIEADIGKLTVTGTTNLADAVARRIAANTGQFMELYASQVYVGQGGNFIYDPQFLDTALNDIRRGFSTGTWTFIKGTATTANAMQTVTATTNNTFMFFREGNPSTSRTKEFIPVTTGQVYDFSVDITTSITANCRWNLYILKADGSVAHTGMTQSSGSGRRVLPYTYTVPDGVVGIFPVVACLTSGVTWTVHGNATFREKVTPSLIVDGLMNGKRIVGASIETNIEAKVGVKMTDDGLAAHGEGVTDRSGTSVAYHTQARISPRTDAAGTWPGLWFDSARKDGKTAPYAFPAGVMPTEADSHGINLVSAQTSALARGSTLSVDDTGITASSASDRPNSTVPPTWNGQFSMTPSHYSLGHMRDGVGYVNRIEGDSAGALDLYGREAIYVRQGANGLRKRLPQGILKRTDYNTYTLITKDTTIISDRIVVPPRATVRMSVQLRGTPNVAGQYTSIYAQADGVNFGEQVIYGQVAWNTHGGNMDFYYTSTSDADKTMTFRLVGNVLLPNPSTYVIHAAGAGWPPSLTVVYEDIGTI